MEALSLRDANIHIQANNNLKPVLKSTTISTKPTNKQKDHPPPPPAEVKEPSTSENEDGIIYRTGCLLGRGAFAVCYEGQNTSTNKKYALKMVKTQMPYKKMEQKFQTELQIHSKMNHANIVKFHRAFSYQKCTYIVLELCPNGSLMDMVKKRKFITEPEVRFWTVQMAGAVKYMHGKGIIHRDLKMGNIFLDKNMNVKVGDFGLAALLMSGKDWQACRRKTLCGTPNYIAPEILSKEKGGHDHAVDIWSLGIIIFAMLTGKPPFQSNSPDEIYRRARELDYEWPSLDKSENFISEETKDLVSKLLQAPEKRPGPDKILQHPFFTCGWIPAPEDMTVSLRERHMDLSYLSSYRNQMEKKTASHQNLKRLCMLCEVGPWTPPKEYTSAYREVELEEKLLLTPSVPLPDDKVYVPANDWLEQLSGENNGKKILEAIKLFTTGVRSPTTKTYAKRVPSVRPLAKSFAAQQRAKPHQPTPSSLLEQKIIDQTAPGISRIKKVRSTSRSAALEAEDRLAVDMFNQLKLVETKDDDEKKFDVLKPSLDSAFSIFEKTDIVKEVPNTKPDFVFKRLRRLKAELERALNSRSVAAEARIPKRSPVIVVKWVDYTNKYGLGYILSNGSVGSIFKAIPAFPQDPSKGLCYSTCILIRNSEKHLVNQTDPALVDYGQLVPISEHKIEFFENRGDQGYFRAEVNPENFRAVPDPNGEAHRLSAGRNEFDNRKKERVIIWRKFGNYMTQYGRDTDYPADEIPNDKTDVDSSAGNFVTFYQRWGDVGCWGFDDGHLQFNFPDHTKIILSVDGTWCDFYHLPLEAARDLSEKGILSQKALDERQHLSYPLQTMLNFTPRNSRSHPYRTSNINPVLMGIPQANDLRRKIEFIVSCLNEWITNHGIGISDLSVEGRLRWSGARQINSKVPYKQVWVCVGGQASDQRKVMWFDPRKPDVIQPDIDC
ncbi:putative serine threonine protein kinase [Golovinomyces cichoracearum]|uniref:Serine/threonine-protein kinase ATG1 n=1 Tax=Golovinomyces cichoracearum TaxID=62708 RepID=A0A420IG96_9PEZI|nr:putative serine threonine protein kinase [Golovinomyces cichoracearum]